MTAQGEDILAWTRNAITRVAEKAEAAKAFGDGFVAGPDAPDCVYGTGPGGPYLRVAIPGFEGQTEAGAEHFALHSPDAVLRRCAADRKLIADHGPWSTTDRSCKGCGFDNHEEPMVTDYSDCPVIQGLAEGYGWTEGQR